MANFQNHVNNALGQYPTGSVFLQWRSSESTAAAKYLRQQIPTMMFPKDEPLLLSIVNFLLVGAPRFPNQPGNIQKLKDNGRLHEVKKHILVL